MMLQDKADDANGPLTRVGKIAETMQKLGVKIVLKKLKFTLFPDKGNSQSYDIEIRIDHQT